MQRFGRLVAAAAMFGFGMTFAQDGGEIIYQSNCAACHQTTGQGLPAVFPPLVGHVPDLLATEGGRAYLIHVLLYGLQGPIVVEGQTYNGLMPAWGQLDDSQIASILNYVATAWENEAALPEGFEDFVAEEIAAERDLGLAPSDVHSQRSELEGAE